MSLCRQTRNSCTALDDEAYNYLPIPPLTQHLIYLVDSYEHGKVKNTFDIIPDCFALSPENTV